MKTVWTDFLYTLSELEHFGQWLTVSWSLVNWSLEIYNKLLHGLRMRWSVTFMWTQLLLLIQYGKTGMQAKYMYTHWPSCTSIHPLSTPSSWCYHCCCGPKSKGSWRCCQVSHMHISQNSTLELFLEIVSVSHHFIVECSRQTTPPTVSSTSPLACLLGNETLSRRADPGLQSTLPFYLAAESFSIHD